MALKKNIVLRLVDLLTHESLEDYKLFLSTPAGTIVGRLLTDEDFDDNYNVGASFASLCNNEVLKLKDSLGLSESESLPNNDGYLILKDVKVLTPPGNVSLPFMIVFFDQIVGASLGQLD